MRGEPGAGEAVEEALLEIWGDIGEMWERYRERYRGDTGEISGEGQHLLEQHALELAHLALGLGLGLGFRVRVRVRRYGGDIREIYGRYKET